MFSVVSGVDVDVIDCVTQEVKKMI